MTLGMFLLAFANKEFVNTAAWLSCLSLLFLQTKFDESIQFREKVQKYLGDVMKYVDHVIKNAGPPDLLRYVQRKRNVEDSITLIVTSDFCFKPLAVKMFK